MTTDNERKLFDALQTTVRAHTGRTNPDTARLDVEELAAFALHTEDDAIREEAIDLLNQVERMGRPLGARWAARAALNETLMIIPVYSPAA